MPVVRDERPVELFDFLYRDPIRIPSYYAQIFGGRLSTVEINTSTKTTSDKVGRAGVGLIGGEFKQSDDKSDSRKEVIDAADLLAAEV